MPYYGKIPLPYESNVYYVMLVALPGVKPNDLQKQIDEEVDIAEMLRDEEMQFFLGCQKFEMDGKLMLVEYWDYCDDKVPMDPLFREKRQQVLDLCEPEPFFMGSHLLWGHQNEILYS